MKRYIPSCAVSSYGHSVPDSSILWCIISKPSGSIIAIIRTCRVRMPGSQTICYRHHNGFGITGKLSAKVIMSIDTHKDKTITVKKGYCRKRSVTYWNVYPDRDFSWSDFEIQNLSGRCRISVVGVQASSFRGLPQEVEGAVWYIPFFLQRQDLLKLLLIMTLYYWVYLLFVSK